MVLSIKQYQLIGDMHKAQRACTDILQFHMLMDEPTEEEIEIRRRFWNVRVESEFCSIFEAAFSPHGPRDTQTLENFIPQRERWGYAWAEWLSRNGFVHIFERRIWLIVVTDFYNVGLNGAQLVELPFPAIARLCHRVFTDPKAARALAKPHSAKSRTATLRHLLKLDS